MTDARLFLGIDGGGTRTRAAVVAQTGQVLGFGEAGPCNPHSVGAEAAMAAIVAAASAAIARANLPSHQLVEAACLGIAGCGTDADAALLAPVGARLPVVNPRQVRIEHDLRIAQAGAFAGEPGLVLVAGTGSACFGVDQSGRTARAGGMGPLFDDLGSAFDIGRRAISHALFAADGRASASLLAARITQALGGDLRAVTRLSAAGADRNLIANLAPLVFTCAAEADQAAGEIIAAAAEELARCVRAAAATLDFGEGPVDVVLLGGLCQAGPALLEPLSAALSRHVLRARMVPEALPPVLGAALLAMRIAGLVVTPTMIAAMKSVRPSSP